MLQNIDISQFLVANSIKTEEELMAKAQEQFAEGKEDLKKFILSKSPKDLQDLVTTAWEMKMSWHVLFLILAHVKAWYQNYVQ